MQGFIAAAALSDGIRRPGPLVAVLIISSSRMQSHALELAMASDGRVMTESVPVCDRGAILTKLRATTAPEVVLLHLPTSVGTILAHAIRFHCPGIRIVAAGVPDDVRQIRAWAYAGATGCVGDEDDVVAAIDVVIAVNAGRTQCSSSISTALFRNVSCSERTLNQQSLLTSRERDVLGLLASGLSSKEIAQRLALEIPTIKNHIHRLYVKLGVHTRLSALTAAQQVGIL